MPKNVQTAECAVKRGSVQRTQWGSQGLSMEHRDTMQEEIEQGRNGEEIGVGMSGLRGK